MFENFIESKTGQTVLGILIVVIMVLALLQGDGPY